MGGLPFCAVMVGVVLGCLINYIFIKTRYVRILRQQGRVPPEERLVPMMVGSILLPIGLFWFAWTSNPEFTWIPQVLAGIPAGAGQSIIRIIRMHQKLTSRQAFCLSSCKASTISLTYTKCSAILPLPAILLFDHFSARAFPCLVRRQQPVRSEVTPAANALQQSICTKTWVLSGQPASWASSVLV